MGLYFQLIFSLFAVTLMVMLPTFTSNSQFVRDTCEKADPGDLDFCVQFLQLDPRSENANLTDLLRFSVELTHKRIVATQSTIKALRSSKKFNEWVNHGLEACAEMYWTAESEYQYALSNLKKNLYYSLQHHLDAAMYYPSDCESGFFEKKNETSPMTQINDQMNSSCKVPQLLSLLLHKREGHLNVAQVHI